MGLMIGNASASDLILNGRSVSLYEGGNPPVKVWPTGPDVVQITLGSGNQARDQFRAALTERGLDHATITEVPFEIELVGTGSAQNMFESCWELASVPDMDTSGVTNMSGMFAYCQSLTHVPDMDTSQVTNMSDMFASCSALTHAPNLDTSNVTDMYAMFSGCGSLTHVPDMDTSKVTNMDYMFFVCTSLTDGNVRLIGKHPNVSTTSMIFVSGLTREPWYTADGAPIDVHEVSLTGVYGSNSVHPLLTVTVPVGETWQVRIQGAATGGVSTNTTWQPYFRIGSADSGRYAEGEVVDFSGTVTAANNTIAMVTRAVGRLNFSGTVTIEKSSSPTTPTGPRVVTVQTTGNQWVVGSQSGDVSMIQELNGGRHLVFSVPVTCDQSINAGQHGTHSAGNRLEAGWVLAPNLFNRTTTFTEIL